MSGFATGSLQLTRDLNRAAVLRLIASSGPIARSTIARELGLSPATVTSLTRELSDQGILRVAERAPSRGGRPALLLEINRSDHPLRARRLEELLALLGPLRYRAAVTDTERAGSKASLGPPRAPLARRNARHARRPSPRHEPKGSGTLGSATNLKGQAL